MEQPVHANVSAPQVAETGEQPLVNERAAARRLGLSPRTLQRWRWVGKGPRYVKLGGAVRYDVDELDRYRAAQTRGPASGSGEEAA